MSGRLMIVRSSPRLDWRRWVRSVVDFVLPPACTICKRPGRLLCEECATTVTWVYGPMCDRCGRVTETPLSVCWSCRQKPPALGQIRTAVWFDGAIPDLVHNLKYNGGFALARLLGRYMIESWPDWAEPIDLLASVPLHSDREKMRGYNQSALLAQVVSEKMGVPFVAEAVRRVRYTRPQVGLKASERQTNLRGAFSADPTLVAGRHVLLIDDVYTTGSTLREVSQAILAAGARRVSGYCLARAK